MNVRLGPGDTGAGRSKRQQLDRLLTVTAPRERLALGLTALLLLSFLVWGLFGRIEHAVTIDGVLVAPGANGGPVQAVVRVVPRLAQRIRPGMPASVAVTMPGGELQVLKAEIVSVGAEPLPNWPAAPQPPAGDYLHRIDISLRQAPQFSVPDGAACRARIVLGRIPPAALLDSERI